MANKLIITEPADLLREMEKRPEMGAVLRMLPARGLSVAFEEGAPRATGARVDRDSILEVLKMMTVIRQGRPVVLYDPKRPHGKWEWIAGTKKV